MTTPTIVLVHGAFADAASWAPVVRELLDRGLSVRVPAGYNRSLIGDAASVRAFVEQIGGPVLLAGHSYGGAVIGIAGAADNVVGLVWAAGYVLEEGETIAQLQGRFPDSPLPPNLVFTPYPTGGGTGTDVSVKIDAVPRRCSPSASNHGSPRSSPCRSDHFLRQSSMSRPLSLRGRRSRAGGSSVAADQTINPDVERFGYQRGAFKET